LQQNIKEMIHFSPLLVRHEQGGALSSSSGASIRCSIVNRKLLVEVPVPPVAAKSGNDVGWQGAYIADGNVCFCVRANAHA
jgi:hypothetical protein